MQSTLIIDARSSLNIFDRIVNETSTAVMWIWWLTLLKPMMHFSLVAILSISFFFDDAKMIASLISVAWLATLLGNTKVTPLLNTSIKVECPEVTAAKDKKVCTVYHDEFGNIVSVK